ncbi:hypothetical protein D1818_12065 [Aquimarina sp. BL5]|uniref:hypothetical protein n=1 Tax=Aquimarina sp. BL5 TaxID=1714860 RepID=UPI000E4C313E|nr:hypothetical protein [Aquimarina sp. BL5]AXT51532.1 hypothetical protein D1818_12065 [Aquimarina sp. BL5]RKN02990.1 hypothetical protein D7036_15110 [Aquimarina sp. BL5]
MEYSLAPSEVKKIIDAKVNGEEYDEEQFIYYHLNRNHFNVKKEVTTLTHLMSNRFRDNRGFIWEEAPRFKNWFHTPKPQYFGSLLGFQPYSRKFLRPDNETGIGGEFEMIIRHDGKRIDALTHEGYQETYNFGPTSNSSLHILLDVDPHGPNPDYTVKIDAGRVTIINREMKLTRRGLRPVNRQ